MKRTFLSGLISGVLVGVFLSTTLWVGWNTVAAAATKIQYKVVETSGNARGFQQALDEYGNEGWELVGTSLHILFLKR